MNQPKKKQFNPMLLCIGIAIVLVVMLIASMSVARASSTQHLSARSSKAAPASRQPALPELVVQKNPGCECCEIWAKHLRAQGFRVRMQENADLGAYKKKVGIPQGKGSCHTGLIAGLFIEGHVPADAIKAALANRKGMRGLVLPGMPGGAPGMAAPPGRAKPYTVEWVDAQGATHPFRTYTPKS